MSYVFDNNAFSLLFHSFYPRRFPSLWRQFDLLVEDGLITSTREVRRELLDDRSASLRQWAHDNAEIFPSPDGDEGAFVGEIFSVPHFRQLLSRRSILKGGRNADPFVVARAQSLNATVVTLEGEPPNGAKIPNVCRHFGVACGSLEDFMEAEDWVF
ncbi:PIN domain-containing protein [Pararhizobium mangrovi]|uniref:PIN domain-containing protein n=1 Tax=Pararhizobium mangrovi TaxID=2590452 RepID=UPI0015E8624A